MASSRHNIAAATLVHDGKQRSGTSLKPPSRNPHTVTHTVQTGSLRNAFVSAIVERVLENANCSGMFTQRFYHPLRHCANKESLNDSPNTVTNALSG